ncbi:unnamed protein product [Oppiella nova]|uniref:Sodium-coupled monocarboxylate transporter 1 n=1 Tax=Oppiella nova TaxID=334625 RepID=A0A7R9LRF4_9ACAR|nr:unnamed protein product [Oppiella nova]CAG2166172.1 unnamed protein product [Oppiella nova]
MLTTSFSIMDYLVFGLLLIISSLIGVYFWFKSLNNTSNDEFLTGKRQLSAFPVCMSLVASFMSTNTLLGLPAEVFLSGTQISAQIISFIIAIVLSAEIFMPIYYRLDILSVNQIPYVAVVLYGPALALSSVTPLSISSSILMVGAICTFYTSIGGIKAVIWTDVLQFILMILGVLMVIIQGALEVGGFQEMWNINQKGGRVIFFNTDVNVYKNDNLLNVIIGTTIIWSANYCCLQTQVQRYCSLGSIQKARRTLYWNLPLLILISLLAVMSGMAIFAKYHDCDPITLGYVQRPDQLMPYFVMDTLSQYPGLAGLFVACVFSGSLSTLSSGFNSLAAITWEDIIKHRIKCQDDRHALKITKLIAGSYGLIAIALAFIVGNAGTVFQASISLVGSMVGPLFALFTLGVLYPYATAPFILVFLMGISCTGSLIGFISGIICGLFLSIGSLLHPKPKVSLPTTTDNCPPDVVKDVYLKSMAFPNSSYISTYDNPEYR